MSVTMLPSKKLATEFELEHFYGAGQRGLRHVALLRRAREVQFIGNRKKIADLVHLHGSAPHTASSDRLLNYNRSIVVDYPSPVPFNADVAIRSVLSRNQSYPP